MKKARIKSLIVLFLIWIGPGSAYLSAQEDVQADTLSPSAQGTDSQIQGPISYEARDMFTDIRENRLILVGDARVVYEKMTLSAAKITLDWESSTMQAEGVMDTVWVRTPDLEDSVRAPRLVGVPEFSEDGDVMRGEVMLYNFKTRKGRVLRGRTAYEDGFYAGEALKIVKPRTMYVSDAVFTTCDREEDPHFHFWADKMRIDVDQKVVARPLVMYIGRIPVAALPFAYFPIRRGRHSGIIIPRYGESSLEGQYLKGLGYYWAPSDYFDLRGTVDYYEKSGFLFRGNMNYAVRYNLRGSLSGSWTRKDFDVLGTKERRWDLSVNHSQEISPTMRLLVSGQFVSSGSFYRDLSANRERRLQQEIRSNATLTKQWGGSASLTVNLNQTRRLDTDETSETLPRISFRKGQFALFSKPEARRGKSVESRWYHSIYASYNSQFLFLQTRDREGTEEDAPLILDRGAGWDHQIRLNSPQKLMGWLTLNPSVNYRETWFNQRNRYFLDPETNSIEEDEETGFFSRRTWNMSTSFSTKIYGLFQPRVLRSVQFRHVATPSFSLQFRPDFSNPGFGYYQSVEDTLGEITEKDLYYGSVFGSTPTGERKSLNMSLQNLFQMKIGEGDQAKKMDLFTWNLSTSYNWAADQYRLGDLSSSLRSSPLKGINLNFRTTHSFYGVDQEGKREHRLLLDGVNISNFLSHGWLRTTYVSASLDLRLSGRAGGGGSGKGPEAPAETGLEGLQNVPGNRLDMDEGITGLDIPWDLTANLSYTENRYNPQQIAKTWWINTSLNFNLTKHWKISYRARFDLMEKEVISQDLVFYRDLHCWEARIVWTPTGIYKRFYFRINVKSPMLRDIKVEKGTGRAGIYGY
jgi:hypothetical protein